MIIEDMTALHHRRCAGADGCRGGWVIADLDGVGVSESLSPNDESRPVPSILGVDMPVGLPDHWGRSCDASARARLAGRASTVFSTVPRSLLDERDFAAANAASRARYGRGLSLQSWSLAPKLREVDALARSSRSLTLVEIHPELSFAAMVGAVLPPKRSAPGQALRAEAIAAWYPASLPDRLPGARRDDILDAVAVLWSALRFADGRHVELTDGAVDRYGLPMRIVF